MSIAKRLLEVLMDEAGTRRVADVRLGLGYSALMLDDGGVGVAFTFRNSFGSSCSVLSGRRPLTGRSAAETLGLIESGHPLEAAVGLATANALTNRPRNDYLDGDTLDVVKVRSDERVGMVGLFAPIMPRLRKEAGEVLVFEKAEREAPPEGLLPSDEEYARLPECQVALLTATSLINGTLDGLLEACRGLREVVILGSSTPLCPPVFEGTPVTLLSGMVVERPGELLRTVSEGGGTRAFRGLVRKVNLRVGR